MVPAVSAPGPPIVTPYNDPPTSTRPPSGRAPSDGDWKAWTVRSRPLVGSKRKTVPRNAGPPRSVVPYSAPSDARTSAPDGVPVSLRATSVTCPVVDRRKTPLVVTPKKLPSGACTRRPLGYPGDVVKACRSCTGCPTAGDGSITAAMAPRTKSACLMIVGPQILTAAAPPHRNEVAQEPKPAAGGQPAEIL